MSKVLINKDNIQLVYELSKSINESYFEFFYRGDFTDRIIQKIVSLVEEKFENDKDTKNIRKRISFIMIECLQNITRHQSRYIDKDIKISDFFSVQKTKNRVLITTNNVIENSKIPELENHIKKINNLSTEELKDLYKKVLSKKGLNKKGGAGLGLISMARKTNGNLEYNFTKINKFFSYFYLQTEIFFNKNTKKKLCNKLFAANRIMSFHESFSEDIVLLNFNGSVAYNSLKNIIPNLKKLKATENNKIKQKVFALTVKLLTNIIFFSDSTLTLKKDKEENNRGIFIMSKQNENLYLTAGNYILNTKAQILKNKINILNETNNVSLKRINKYLSEFFSVELKNRPDISLIDMKLQSNNNLHYSFSKVSNSHSFFTIQVIV